MTTQHDVERDALEGPPIEPLTADELERFGSASIEPLLEQALAVDAVLLQRALLSLDRMREEIRSAPFSYGAGVQLRQAQAESAMRAVVHFRAAAKAIASLDGAA